MKSVLLLLGVSCTLSLSAQESVISSWSYPRKAYVGIDNSISIFVEGYRCASLVVKTNNGTITKYGCQYNVRPAELKDAEISIYRKSEGKLVKIKSYTLAVIPTPKPVAQVGPYVNGSNVDGGAFRAQMGVSALRLVNGHDWGSRVVSYTFIIITDSTITFSKTVTGNLFDIEIREACKTLQPGHAVLIANIWVIGPEGVRTKTDPLEYSII